jgi:ribonucleoside-diphosphate reductase alpha subunit
MSDEKRSKPQDQMSLGQAFAHAEEAPEQRPPSAPAPPTTYVVNRRGEKIPVLFDTITERNEDLRSNPAYGPELCAIDSPAITAAVVRRFCNGMSTRELDAETAGICIGRSTHHPDYDALASRIYVSDLHKRTPAALPDMVDAIIAAAPSRATVRLSDEYIAIVRRAAAEIDAALDMSRDFRLRFFGYQTIARSYLLRPASRREESSLLDDQVMERPQHLYMRVALGIFVCQPDKRGHEADDLVFAQRLAAAFEFYDALSLQRVSNATPTMLNASTNVEQLSSCFQVATGDDLPTLFDTVKSTALISKWSGGVSLWLHNIRAEGAPIRSTGGRCSGIKRYMKILNEVQLYVDQGGNRPGAFALYLSVDHDDIFTFLSMVRLKGEEALRSLNAPDLKYALWVPDLFMEALTAQLENTARAAAGGTNDPQAGDWHLFSPDEAPGLHLVYGAEYKALYTRYVAEGRSRRRVKAGDIISEAFKSWTQAGVPYVLFKDACCRKSNMKNVAPPCSSNLCTEILIPSWSGFDAPDFARFHPDNAAGGETGVCNLGAICLESFIVPQPGGEAVSPHAPKETLDFAGIAAAAGLETRALNRVIDLNYYPSEECRRSNRRHRPIGIGVMGLADVLARLAVVYGSPSAQAVARGIAATVYYGALLESCRLAKALGRPYETFAGSPLESGKLQPDLWVEEGTLAANWELEVEAATGGYLTPRDWAELRIMVMKYGVINAYVTACMPTATTSNIAGQNECFEPFTSNIYTRKTLAGEFLVINRHLMRRLTALGLWDEKMRRELLAAGGSVQEIARVPTEVRRLFRTARELHPSFTIYMAKAMAPFICQSMSMNLFLDEPNLPKIIRFLVEGWRAGLKTGMYYCHTKAATGSQKTSIVVTDEVAPPQAPVEAKLANAGAALTGAGGSASPEAVAGLRAQPRHLVCNEEVCTSCAI